MGRRKKKTPQEEICDGFRQLAFGTVQDAVALLLRTTVKYLRNCPNMIFLISARSKSRKAAVWK